MRSPLSSPRTEEDVLCLSLLGVPPCALSGRTLTQERSQAL